MTRIYDLNLRHEYLNPADHVNHLLLLYWYLHMQELIKWQIQEEKNEAMHRLILELFSKDDSFSNPKLKKRNFKGVSGVTSTGSSSLEIAISEFTFDGFCYFNKGLYWHFKLHNCPIKWDSTEKLIYEFLNFFRPEIQSSAI